MQILSGVDLADQLGFSLIRWWSKEGQRGVKRRLEKVERGSHLDILRLYVLSLFFFPNSPMSFCTARIGAWSSKSSLIVERGSGSYYRVGGSWQVHVKNTSRNRSRSARHNSDADAVCWSDHATDGDVAFGRARLTDTLWHLTSWRFLFRSVNSTSLLPSYVGLRTCWCRKLWDLWDGFHVTRMMERNHDVAQKRYFNSWIYLYFATESFCSFLGFSSTIFVVINHFPYFS